MKGLAAEKRALKQQNADQLGQMQIAISKLKVDLLLTKTIIHLYTANIKTFYQRDFTVVKDLVYQKRKLLTDNLPVK